MREGGKAQRLRTGVPLGGLHRRGRRRYPTLLTVQRADHVALGLLETGRPGQLIKSVHTTAPVFAP